MDIQEHYSNLVKEFEQGLNRQLQDEERQLVQWMAGKAAENLSKEKQLVKI